MTSVYDLKPKFQKLLRPLCAEMMRVGVTANQITLAAMFLSMAMGIVLFLTEGALWTLFLLPVVLFVRMALNALDGMLAREFGQTSKLGAVLNELGDVVSDTALYLPFAVIAGVDAMLVALIVAIAIISEMAGVVAIPIGATRHYNGPFGKSDRALFFGIFALALGFGVAPGIWCDIALVLAAAAGILTIFNRARGALADAKS